MENPGKASILSDAPRAVNRFWLWCKAGTGSWLLFCFDEVLACESQIWNIYERRFRLRQQEPRCIASFTNPEQTSAYGVAENRMKLSGVADLAFKRKKIV